MVADVPVAIPFAGEGRGVAAERLTCGPITDVTFAVEPGTVCALLGKNGVGKSTLLRVLAGLAAPTSGDLHLDTPVGYAPQDYRASLFPWLSAEDNVGLLLRGLRLAPSSRHERVRAAAAAVGVDDALLVRRPVQLSGGEQQLLCLARSLAVEPRVLLLDEPFAALDVATRVRARRAVADYAHRTQAAVVLATHDLDDVIDIADRAVVVTAGDPWLATDLAARGTSPAALRTALLRACGEEVP